MPNWVTNKIALKGTKKDLLAFLNLGLKNMGKEEKNNLDDAYDEITNSEERITMGTFRAIPQTFLDYDTTNYPDKYPDAVKEQREKYGVVGWYDYNRLVAFGCKWNTELTDWAKTKGDNDMEIISFYTDTPWAAPEHWTLWIKETFPDLGVYVCTREEQPAWACYGEQDDSLGSFIEYPEADYLADIDEVNHGVDDDDWDTALEKIHDIYDRMECEFMDWVYIV